MGCRVVETAGPAECRLVASCRCDPPREAATLSFSAYSAGCVRARSSWPTLRVSGLCGCGLQGPATGRGRLHEGWLGPDEQAWQRPEHPAV